MVMGLTKAGDKPPEKGQSLGNSLRDKAGRKFMFTEQACHLVKVKT
jgi:hypothetical protein